MDASDFKSLHTAGVWVNHGALYLEREVTDLSNNFSFGLSAPTLNHLSHQRVFAYFKLAIRGLFFVNFRSCLTIFTE